MMIVTNAWSIPVGYSDCLACLIETYSNLTFLVNNQEIYYHGMLVSTSAEVTSERIYIPSEAYTRIENYNREHHYSEPIIIPDIDLSDIDRSFSLDARQGYYILVS